MTGPVQPSVLGVINELPPEADSEERTRLARSTDYADGSSEFWQVAFDGYVYHAHLFHRASPESPWVTSERSAQVPKVLEAFDVFPEMRELTIGAIIRFYLTTKWGVSELDVVHLLAVVSEPAQSGEPATDSTSPLAVLPPDVTGDFEELPLTAMINGQPIRALMAGGATSGRVLPVLGDSEGGLHPVKSLAIVEWNDDASGSDVGVGHAIDRLNRDLLNERSWVGREHLEERRLVPDSDHELGRFLAEWVTRNQLEIATALELEPFDPLQSVSEHEWRGLLEDAGLRASFGISLGALAFLRSELTGDERYRRCALALALPDSSDGRQLHAVLAEVAATGENSRLRLLTWDGPEAIPDPTGSVALSVPGRNEASLRGLKVADLRRILIIELKTEPDGNSVAALRKQIFEEQGTLSERRMLRWIGQGDGYLFYDPEKATFWQDFLVKMESLGTWGETVALIESDEAVAQVMRAVVWSTWEQSEEPFGLDSESDEFAGVTRFEDLLEVVPTAAPVAFTNENGDGELAVVDPFSPVQMGVPWQIRQRYYEEASNMVSSWLVVPGRHFDDVVAAASALGWMVAEGSWDDLW